MKYFNHYLYLTCFVFFQYRYTTVTEKCLLCFGLLAAVVTGSIQPCNSILFGDLTGTIIAYAQSLYNTTIDRKKAEDDLMNGISNFALLNSLIGIIMLVSSYISTTSFNYVAMRQVRIDFIQQCYNF